MMRVMRFLMVMLLAPLLALLLPMSAKGAAPSAVVNTPQVQAELVAHAPEGVASGKPLMLGLIIHHQPHWHTYWKNPGDSGLPTTLQWQLPAGINAGDIQWPTPKKLPVGPLLNYGYEGTVLLPVPLLVAAGFTGNSLDIRLHADWLVCKDVCIPESGDFAISVPAQAATAMHAALFEVAKVAAPQAAPGALATAQVDGGAFVLTVAGLPAALRGRKLDFIPEIAGLLNNAAQPETSWQGADWQARIPLDPQRTDAPARLPAVLISAGQTAGLQLQVAMKSAWPPVTAVAAAPLPALGDAVVSTPPDAPMGMGLALLLAMAGGALLNLMPCVFPVLSLKVLGFATHGENRRAQLAGGLAYTAGVVLSFVALAAMLLGLRASGEQLGWGFQLQSPGVVAALAALFTLIGLNLAGVFEVGSVLPNSVACARARHPLVDSLLTGVLAVAVASPCTAPFMGASLGLAFSLPPVQALSIFAALGIGMALPYLAASAWPGLARALPRPGRWMAHFKSVMAFPMFATVVWLVWVLGVQAGIDGAAALLGLLVVLAFAAWALGSPTLGRKARRRFGSVAVLALGVALVWALPAFSVHQAVASPSPNSAWQPWSPERVAELTAQGKPVFVDFTAAWCVTCQFNKRTTLADAGVKADFERRGVALLRADWTRRDAAITAELARLGRNGVPVYALYAASNLSPRLLSEVLTPQELHAALASLK